MEFSVTQQSLQTYFSSTDDREAFAQTSLPVSRFLIGYLFSLPGREVSINQLVQPPLWAPKIIYSLAKEIYHYVGEDIVIYETIDSYGAIMWPAALALCSFLENNREIVNLQGAQVLELGAGTGLVSIVASLLGASVTATDLPVVLSNLRANVLRNTRGRCRELPKVDVLSWSFDLKRSHPTGVHQYDYILAADVVYQHDFLEELLATMKHFCGPGTAVIWANKVRLGSDLTFTENFKKAFHTSLLFEDGDMKIFKGTCRRS
uniref:Methyltransferase 21C, AARS1 lysine n=1 Tax=Cynoglossus semilaevis TaxID=244447 RepID=A0A3P8V634_CYNSE